MGGLDIISNKYNFVGNIIETKQEHTIDGTTNTIVKHFEYDHTGRLLETKMKLNTNDTITIAKNDYNELGQLTGKNTHEVSEEDYLINSTLTYNIRGWITTMNYTNKDGGVIFNLGLHYNDATNAQYNGNIGAITWNSSQLNELKTYNYTYDGLSRILSADYSDASGSGTGNYNTSYGYDLNGNIKTLNRSGQYANGNFGEIDKLDYAYNGNQLIKVNDISAESDAKFAGFTDNDLISNDVIATDENTHEYLYDANGNMITDHNKQIELIKYNYLNLPVFIDLGNNNIIEYIYDAAGIKLQQKVYKEGNLEKQTDYIANFVYENGSLKFISTDDGRLVPNADTTGFDYEYFIKDHLGNTRATVKDSLGFAVVEQEDHYYPFGMRMEGQSYTNPLQAAANKYLYNGKELQDDLGLMLYDYGRRYYDFQTLRFTSVDPMAHLREWGSPYNYVQNNPINRIDPNGALDTPPDWYRNSAGDLVNIQGYSGDLSSIGLERFASDDAILKTYSNTPPNMKFYDNFKEFAGSKSNPVVAAATNPDNAKVAAYTLAVPLAVIGSAEILAGGIISTEFWAGKAAVSAGTQAITNRGNVDLWDVGVDALCTPGASALFGGPVDIIPGKENPIRIIGINKSLKQTGIDVGTELLFNKAGDKIFNNMKPFLKNKGEKILFNTVIGLPMSSVSKGANYIIREDENK